MVTSEWLTSRPKPEGFYGLSAFMKSIDTKLLGRKTYELSRSMGATFSIDEFVDHRGPGLYRRRHSTHSAPLP